MSTIECMNRCGAQYCNPYVDVPDDTAVRAAGWGSLPYQEGIRYVCPDCRRPLPLNRGDEGDSGQFALPV